MSANSTGRGESFRLAPETPEQDGAGTLLRQESDLPPAPVGTSSPIDEQGLQKAHTVRLWIWPLIIICLGSLGALSIAPNMFPAVFVALATKQGPVSPAVASGTVAFRESECTATPQTLRYVPARSAKADTQTLPGVWCQAGYSRQSFTAAKSCAAFFVSTYQTFDNELNEERKKN